MMAAQAAQAVLLLVHFMSRDMASLLSAPESSSTSVSQRQCCPRVRQ